MSALGGLGLFGRLPQEVRDMIYIHFMHWHNTAMHQMRDRPPFHTRVPRNWDNDSFKWHKLKNRERKSPSDTLALMRASKTLCSELSYLLYHGWTIEFLPGITDLDSWRDREPYRHAAYPKFTISIRHPARGFLFLLDSVSIDDFCQGKFPIPYWHFDRIMLAFQASYDSDAGQIHMCWRASQLLAGLLEQSSVPLPPIEVKVCGNLDQERLHEVVTSTGVKSLSRLEMLASPLRRCGHVTCQYKPEYLQLHEFLAAENGKLKSGLDFDKIDENATVNGDEFTPGDEDFVDMYLDLELDELAGDTAKRLREQRWLKFHRPYKKSFIRTAYKSMLVSGNDQALSDLVERWAVRKSMDPCIVKADQRRWLCKEVKPIYHKGQCYLFEDNRFVWKWSRVHCSPRYRDWHWEQLKYDGLYYCRRILVTTHGILWDPNHTIRTINEPYVPQEDVIFVHEPPPKPSQRPMEEDDDPLYYFKSYIDASDSSYNDFFDSDFDNLSEDAYP